MGVFKNEVGRPSNKTIMLRRILKISLLILIIGFFGITLYFFSNNKAGKLKGAAVKKIFKDESFEHCVSRAYGEANNLNQYPMGNDLTQKQLNTIKKLTCNSVVYDYSGIEYLKGLEVFEVKSGNGRRKLNLDFSGNTKLKKLAFYSAGPTKINLKKNVNLTSLDIHSVELEDLDLSKNVNLKTLILSNTYLTKIDLSKNTNLTKLEFPERYEYCNNDLTTINLKNNKKLKWLTLNRTKLVDLDLSQNKNLSYLDLSMNDFEEIDLSNQKNLETLYISINKFRNLDLSDKIKLKNLDIRHNMLDTINLSKNINLETLSISDFEKIDLRKNQKINSLKLSGKIGEILFHDKTKIKKLSTEDISNPEKILNYKNVYLSLTSLNLGQNTKEVNLSKLKNLEKLVLEETELKKLDLSNNVKLKELKVEVFTKPIDEIIVTDDAKIKYDIYYAGNPKITIKKLGLKCPTSVKAKEEFECQTNQSGATISVSKTNLAKGYSEKITTKNGNKTRKVKYTAPGYITVKVSKPGYKSVQKKVQILNSNDIVLKCPTTAKVNELFKCTSNLAGVNITASKDGFSGNVLTYTTTAKDKVKDLRYNKAGTITVTASKSGYKTVSKQVKIELDDSLTLKCPTTAKVNEWFKCTSNLAGVKITASSAGFSGNVLSYITSSSDKVKDLRYNKAGTITVTASKSGYKTVNKKVVIK